MAMLPRVLFVDDVPFTVFEMWNILSVVGFDLCVCVCVCFWDPYEY